MLTGLPRRHPLRMPWLSTRVRRQSPLRNAVSDDEGSENEEPMDPEELAALNAIINTRRSMAAAQALAKQTQASKELVRSYSLPAHLTAHTGTPPMLALQADATRHASTAERSIRFAPLPQPTIEIEAADEQQSALSYDDERGLRLSRSISTGALGLRSSIERARLGIEDDERRPRSWRLSRTGRARSPSDQSPPPRTLEEKMRRREMIRATRPGGTGMVTLLDGERIKARQVGDPDHERVVGEDVQAQLWGFAALERARSRDGELPQLGLSSAKAEEVQRRHESEVEALGAEALAHVRRERPRRGDAGTVPGDAGRGRSRPHSPDHPRSRSTPGSSRSHSEARDTDARLHERVRAIDLARSFSPEPDPSVSIPIPEPYLPRRPDARGISVVPLPQLGRRPQRPREGRAWADWDLSDSDDEYTTPASQWPVRATARAAEQEVVHGRRIAQGARQWGGSDAKHVAVRVAAHADQDEFWPAPSATRRIGAPRRASLSYGGLMYK